MKQLKSRLDTMLHSKKVDTEGGGRKRLNEFLCS